MGYSTVIERDQESGCWALLVRANLSRAESNELFLSGDSMVSWPVEGLQSSGDVLLERSSMFVSEVAAQASGLRLRYAERAQAERADAVLRVQFGRFGIAEET